VRWIAALKDNGNSGSSNATQSRLHKSVEISRDLLGPPWLHRGPLSVRRVKKWPLRRSGIDRTLAPKLIERDFLHIVEMVVPPGGLVIRFKLVREMKALVRTGEKK
jgi:hypothetical protein